MSAVRHLAVLGTTAYLLGTGCAREAEPDESYPRFVSFAERCEYLTDNEFEDERRFHFFSTAVAHPNGRDAVEEVLVEAALSPEWEESGTRTLLRMEYDGESAIEPNTGRWVTSESGRLTCAYYPLVYEAVDVDGNSTTFTRNSCQDLP